MFKYYNSNMAIYGLSQNY